MAQTHFGYQTVEDAEKATRVRGVFDSVAPKYDLMNDVLSLGLHRAWKAYTVAVANLREGQRVLDIAGVPGIWRGRSRRRSARPARSSTPTSTRRCCGRAATACSTRGWCCPR